MKGLKTSKSLDSIVMVRGDIVLSCSFTLSFISFLSISFFSILSYFSSFFSSSLLSISLHFFSSLYLSSFLFYSLYFSSFLLSISLLSSSSLSLFSSFSLSSLYFVSSSLSLSLIYSWSSITWDDERGWSTNFFSWGCTVLLKPLWVVYGQIAMVFPITHDKFPWELHHIKLHFWSFQWKLSLWLYSLLWYSHLYWDKEFYKV